MRRTLALASVFALTLVVAAAVPGASQDATGPVSMMGVWADTPTVAFLQPSLAIENPAGKRVSLCDAPTACKGPVSGFVPFAGAVNPLGQEFRIVGDLVGTVWISTTVAQLPVQGLRMELVQTNGANVVPTNLGSYAGTATTPMVKGDGSVVVIGTSPTKFVFSGTPPANKIKADTTLSLRIQINSIGVGRPDAAVPEGTSPIDIFVHYGTPEFATGVVFPVDVPAGGQAIGCPLEVSLAQESLTLGRPSATDSLSRVIEVGPSLPRLHTLIAGTEFEWGKVAVPSATTILSDATFQVTLRAPATVEPYFGLTANLYFGPQKVNGSSQVALPPVLMSTTSPPGTSQVTVRFALPTAGVAVDGGKDLRLTLQVYSTNTPDGLEAALPGIEALYGSTTDPSGFRMAATNAECSPSAAPPQTTAPEEPEPEPEPEETAAPTETGDDDSDPRDEEPGASVEAGSAKEATVKDVTPPVNVPAPGVVATALLAIGLLVGLRRRR